jgi:hypothetical protein
MRLQPNWAVLCSVIVLATGVLPARAVDDTENSMPTAWWTYSGQSYSDIGNTITTKNARISDIKPENSSGSSFTVAYVQNTGSYAKQWWWYVGIDANTLTGHLKANNARLISLKAYDTGSGNIRFAAAMIANIGADAKSWWWYHGKSSADITNLLKTNNARLTALESYESGGQTVYVAAARKASNRSSRTK